METSLFKAYTTLARDMAYAQLTKIMRISEATITREIYISKMRKREKLHRLITRRATHTPSSASPIHSISCRVVTKLSGLQMSEEESALLQKGHLPLIVFLGVDKTGIKNKSI